MGDWLRARAPRVASLLVSVVLLGWGRATVRAQVVPPDWNGPFNLSRTDTDSRSPSIVADQAGVLHVVWSEELEDGSSALYYARNEEGVWSPGLDVLVTPGNPSAQAPSLAVDAGGYLHVAWNGGGSVYYSNAYAPEAGSARGWRTPQPLVAFQNYLGAPDLAMGGSGDVHVVYAKQIGTDSGIYYVRSRDGGGTWLAPEAVYLNPREDRMIDRARLAIGPDGGIHVVWIESDYPETYPPLGLRYARSGDDGATWTEPLSLGEGPYDYPGIAVRGDGQVHVVWSGTATDRFKFHVWSGDGTGKWSNVWHNVDLGGYQGWPAVVADSAETLHWLEIGFVFSLGDDFLTHSAWREGRWLPGTVVLGDEVSAQNPQNVSAAIALGNELHAVVQVPVPAEGDTYQFDIMHVYRALEAEGQSAEPLPEPTAIAVDQDTGALVSPETGDAEVAVALPDAAAGVSTNPPPPGLQPAMVGALPVLALIAILVGVYAYRQIRGEPMVDRVATREHEPVLVIQATRGWASLQLRALWEYRELLYFLVWRDLKVRYKQTVLGVAWIILRPVVSMVVFSFLFGALLGVPSGNVPYPVFAYAGLLPWNYFASSLTRSSTSVVSSAHLITKVYFPRLIIPTSGVLSGLVDLAIAFVVLIGLMVTYSITPTPAIVFLPAFVLLAMLTALGFGLWLSALNVRYRDVNYLIPFLVQIWMYLTPVIYGSTLIPEQYRFLLALNPMTGVVEGFRWALLGNQLADARPPGWLFVASVAITLVVLVSGALFFRRTERTFADVI